MNSCHRLYSAALLILVLCFIPACKDGSVTIPGINTSTPGDPFSGDQGSHFELHAPYLYPAWTDPAGLSWDVPINTPISVHYYASIDPLTVTPDTLIVTDPGNNPVAGSLFVSANTITFTPSDRLAPQTLYSVAVTTGVRPADSTEFLEPLLWSFTTGTTVQPSVISTTPLQGGQGMPLNASISVVFRIDIDPLTVTPSTFSVLDPGNNPVSGSFSVSGNTATFTPDLLLAANTLYTVTVTKGILASYGGPFMEPMTWTFTTGATVSPSIIAAMPASGAQDWLTNAALSVVFSANIDPSTVTPSTFIVTDVNNVPVDGSFLVSGSTITFIPNYVFADYTPYTVSVTSGILTANGGLAVDPFTWTFTTGSIAMPMPTVIATTPSDGAQDVPVDATVELMLREPLPAYLFSTYFGTRFEDLTGTVSYGGASYDAQRLAITAISQSALMPATDYCVWFTMYSYGQSGPLYLNDYFYSVCFRTAP